VLDIDSPDTRSRRAIAGLIDSDTPVESAGRIP